MDQLELSLFASRIAAVCAEMGAKLRSAAFSPNIRDRSDCSCAVFDPRGRLLAQAADIPVHLGSMAYALHDVVGRFDWRAGDEVVFNDPFMGGTHLPDVTLVAPFFGDGRLLGFVANRAHHADIGADEPGGMPLSSSLSQEGPVIAPQYIARNYTPDRAALDSFVAAACNPGEEYGDYMAQIAANRNGIARLAELFSGFDARAWFAALDALNEYGGRLARTAYAAIPDGDYTFADTLDDDGFGTTDIAIRVTLRVRAPHIEVDFASTAPQVTGNVNCPKSVTAAAVYYVFRCLLPSHAPTCQGVFSPITLRVPEGCLLNANPGAGVAAGNTETSSRTVDCVIGALAGALPEQCVAASQGTMNNVALGRAGDWAYYETLGGGMGAGRDFNGGGAAQTHMTNTLNTPVEMLEMKYPLRIRRYALRRGSGGRGRFNGGDGLVREYEFLSPTRLILLTERRRRAPWGYDGGGDGAPGRNVLNGRELPGKVSLSVGAGDRLCIETPGGGAWGAG